MNISSPSVILSHRDELLPFVPYFRPSEVCLIAHGYQHVGLKSIEWWNKFATESVQTMFDMDGKEMAGLLYSFSKVVTLTIQSKHYLMLYYQLIHYFTSVM